MMYTIVWKKKSIRTMWGTYIEYGDVEKVKNILDFLEKNNEEFELVSITPCED